MPDEYDMQDVMPGKKKSRHSDIISQLEKFTDDDYTTPSGYEASSFLPSSMLKEKPKKEKEENNTGFEYDPDAWFNELMGYQNVKVNKHRGRSSLFDSTGIARKKKKKKKKEEKANLTDFKKEFAPEAALYKNLMVEQTRFTESLQREYDAIKSTKSSARGVTKQMTDLVENINGARQLSMQLIDKQVAIKKQVAELSMKQQKDFGSKSSDEENMADFASSYLKQMLNERQVLFNGGEGETTVSDYTDQEIFDELSSSLSGEEYERPEEAELYLKYENRNVTIYVVIANDNVEDYWFLAKDEEDNTIDDYPLPERTKISVNRSTGIATDTYGKKYQIIWE
jgi:hypothetical protein